MSKDEKLLKRFLSEPNDFSYQELVRLLTICNYQEMDTGKTSGSRVRFVNPDTLETIRIHKPHPDNIVKICYLKRIKEQLKTNGCIIDFDGDDKNE